MWEDEVFTPQRNWKQKLVGDILFRGRRCEAVVVSKLIKIFCHILASDLVINSESQ